MGKKDKSFNNSSLKEKFGMAKNFAQALISRGVSNRKTDDTTKRLRVLSCLGDGRDLPPCEYLRESSKDSSKSYCGGCGCGDRKGTWLIAEADEYSKLDYPKVHCPLQMPGFINYEESDPDEANDPITRRYYIEQMTDDQVEQIVVNIPDPPEPKEEPKKD